MSHEVLSEKSIPSRRQTCKGPQVEGLGRARALQAWSNRCQDQTRYGLKPLTRTWAAMPKKPGSSQRVWDRGVTAASLPLNRHSSYLLHRKQMSGGKDRNEEPSEESEALIQITGSNGLPHGDSGEDQQFAILTHFGCIIRNCWWAEHGGWWW